MALSTPNPSASSTKRAPRHLSIPQRRLWDSIVQDYALHDDPPALKLTTLLCEAADRAEEARKALAADGPFVADRFGVPRAHPALKVEHDATIRVARLARELRLDLGGGEPLGDVRIPRINGALA